MFVPIFMSFGIENSSQHSALISLLKLYFILFCDPRVSTRGIASIINWTLGTNFSEILIKILTFSFKKMHFKVSSTKWRPFVSAFMC